MKLWRCENENCEACGREFEGASPACPACGAALAVELVPVHYLVPADGPIRTGLGGRMVACSPKMRELPQSSGDRSAVTCPRCKASDIFIEDERDGVSNHVRYFERMVSRTA